MRKFLASMYEPRRVATVPDKVIYCSFPYFGKTSEKLASEVQDLFKKYFSNVSLKVILNNSFTVGSFFRFKDTLPFQMRASLVYQFSCARCASAYVGMTTRNLYARIAEHRGRSFRTGNVLATPLHSAIRDHTEGTCDVRISDEDFRILSSSKSDFELRILESLYIFKLSPPLNNSNSSYPLQLTNRWCHFHLLTDLRFYFSNLYSQFYKISTVYMYAFYHRIFTLAMYII